MGLVVVPDMVLVMGSWSVVVVGQGRVLLGCCIVLDRVFSLNNLKRKQILKILGAFR